MSNQSSTEHEIEDDSVLSLQPTWAQSADLSVASKGDPSMRLIVKKTIVNGSFQRRNEIIKRANTVVGTSDTTVLVEKSES